MERRTATSTFSFHGTNFLFFNDIARGAGRAAMPRKKPGTT